MPNFCKIDDFRHFNGISRPVQMPFTSIELFKFIKTDINELFDSFLDIFLIMQALLTKFVLLEKKIFTPPSKKLKMKNLRFWAYFFHLRDHILSHVCLFPTHQAVATYTQKILKRCSCDNQNYFECNNDSIWYF